MPQQVTKTEVDRRARQTKLSCKAKLFAAEKSITDVQSVGLTHDEQETVKETAIERLSKTDHMHEGHDQPFFSLTIDTREAHCADSGNAGVPAGDDCPAHAARCLGTISPTEAIELTSFD